MDDATCKCEKGTASIEMLMRHVLPGHPKCPICGGGYKIEPPSFMGSCDRCGEDVICWRVDVGEDVIDKVQAGMSRFVCPQCIAEARKTNG